MAAHSLFIDSRLPNPLSREELTACFVRLRSGDFIVRDKIIICNIKLVLNQVNKKFHNTFYDKNELVSVGIIGLIKAVDTFDLEKNVEFSSYAIRCINNEILMFMRKGKKYIGDYSLDDVMYTNDSGDEISLIDSLEDEKVNFVDRIIDEDLYKLVREIVRKLPDREREIIILYFGFFGNRPHTQEEIANKFGLSRSYISRIFLRTLDKLKLEFIQEGIIGIEYINRRPYARANKYNSSMKRTKGYECGCDECKTSSDSDGVLDDTSFSNGYSNEDNSRVLTNTSLDNGTDLENTCVFENDCFSDFDILSIKSLPGFDKFIMLLEAKDAIILCLRVGYVDSKCFSTFDIANFLGISEVEVLESLKRSLLCYKNNVNSLFDVFVRVLK